MARKGKRRAKARHNQRKLPARRAARTAWWHGGVMLGDLARVVVALIAAIGLALCPIQVADLLGIVVPHMQAHGFTPATAFGLLAVGLFSLWGVIFWLVIQHMLMSRSDTRPA